MLNTQIFYNVFVNFKIYCSEIQSTKNFNGNSYLFVWTLQHDECLALLFVVLETYHYSYTYCGLRPRTDASFVYARR